MSNPTSPDPIAVEPRRFSIRLPRPMSIFLATVLLVVVSVGLRFGIPIYRQQVAIREIEQVGGSATTVPGGPAWLRKFIGDERMKIFDQVEWVEFASVHSLSAKAKAWLGL